MNILLPLTPLKHFREKYKMTQNELCHELGYVKRTVSKWEQGVRCPSLHTLIAIRACFQDKHNKLYPTEIFPVTLDKLAAPYLEASIKPSAE